MKIYLFIKTILVILKIVKYNKLSLNKWILIYKDINEINLWFYNIIIIFKKNSNQKIIIILL